MAPRQRGYCFTLNNPGPTTEATLESVPGYRYLTFGREVAPTTGTRHLQGYVYFQDAKSLKSVRRLLLGAHVEIARSISPAIVYCQKDGDFAEFGVRPMDDQDRGTSEKERWQTTWDLAKANRIEEIPVDIRVRCYSTCRRIAKDYMVRPTSLAAPCGTWVYGRSGVGKTHSVYTCYPGLYSKNGSKWWDGYQGEDVILFDDMDPSIGTWCTRFFKIWADERPFIADVKNGSIYIRPTKFIVTSQYTIEECFGEIETRDALNRRFSIVNKVDRETEIVI